MRDLIRDELAGWPIDSGYYATAVSVEAARDMADAVLAVLADHDANVRAEALREAADVIKPPEIEPESPYSYDPWDDESVDPDNTSEVVSAAASRGWDRGAYIARVGIHRQLLDMAGGESS